jgi:hypothetical protein
VQLACATIHRRTVEIVCRFFEFLPVFIVEGGGHIFDVANQWILQEINEHGEKYFFFISMNF